MQFERNLAILKLTYDTHEVHYTFLLRNHAPDVSDAQGPSKVPSNINATLDFNLRIHMNTVWYVTHSFARQPGFLAQSTRCLQAHTNCAVEQRRIVCYWRVEGTDVVVRDG